MYKSSNQAVDVFDLLDINFVAELKGLEYIETL